MFGLLLCPLSSSFDLPLRQLPRSSSIVFEAAKSPSHQDSASPSFSVTDPLHLRQEFFFFCHLSSPWFRRSYPFPYEFISSFFGPLVVLPFCFDPSPSHVFRLSRGYSFLSPQNDALYSFPSPPETSADAFRASEVFREMPPPHGFLS